MISVAGSRPGSRTTGLSVQIDEVSAQLHEPDSFTAVSCSNWRSIPVWPPLFPSRNNLGMSIERGKFLKLGYDPIPLPHRIVVYVHYTTDRAHSLLSANSNPSLALANLTLSRGDQFRDTKWVISLSLIYLLRNEEILLAAINPAITSLDWPYQTRLSSRMPVLSVCRRKPVSQTR